MHNSHGLDADYFIRLCAREFSPDVIRNQNPEDLARALARASRTACAEVLQEREFQPSAAAHDVLVERWRQVNVEGWTPEHDNAHDAGVMCGAAAAYAINAGDQLHPLSQGDGQNAQPFFWPWDAKWWKPGKPRRDLVKAAALILAEIERLDRAEKAKQQAAQ